MSIVRTPAAVLVLTVLAAATLASTGAQSIPFYPLDDVRPGMVAVGRTVFAGDTLEEFRAHIIGVLRNTIGPKQDLVLARLEGGPLAQTGVIRGMSGSPVYIDGKLLGAVSYQLGSFPREPIAGITPIREMVEAIDGGTGRTAPRSLALEWPASEAAVFGALQRLTALAASPLSAAAGHLSIVGPASLTDLVPTIRPIGTAMVLSGFDPQVRARLTTGAASRDGAPRSGDQSAAGSAAPTLRPGDAVGMSLLRGDIEMGATGTVTHVDDDRVYAFGHPFLSLGTTQLAMTRSHVYTVLPSLDTSMKIASLGPVIGIMGQDRSTAVGGRLGAGPPELKISIALSSARAGNRDFTYYALHDPQLTPLFAFVAILNTLVSYERQNGELSIAAGGSVTFADGGRIVLDDFFTGPGALGAAAGGLTAAIGAATTNGFRTVMPTSLDLELRASEGDDWTTIERVWLDTVKPRAGGTYALNVELRRHRGALETLAFPVTMPQKVTGPVTIIVSDGPSLTTLERQELRPGRPTSWPALFAELQAARSNNRVYVRLVTTSAGTVVSGETLPGLPQSVRNALEADQAGAQSPVGRTVLGQWERRMERAVRGSREITVTLGPPN